MKAVFSTLLVYFTFLTIQAQNFGQNKPHYTRFDFEVYQTPHFDLYHYLDNPDFRDEIAKNAEQWYLLHQAILKDTFEKQNPIILYSTHAEFQQTTTISGSIGEGTGGVTESLKNRVVFPVLFSNQQTGHVLGHELVHAFQYHLIFNFNKQETEKKRKLQEQIEKSNSGRKAHTGKKKENPPDTVKAPSPTQPLILLADTVPHLIDFRNLPLWMVEGMAEYLSIGRNDPNTAMWMRDAVSSGDVPTIKDLNDYSKYFPYRWGQSFWAFIASTYGEEMLLKLFIETGQWGLNEALIRNFGMDTEAFGKIWQTHLKNYYGSIKEVFPGDTLSHIKLTGGESKSGRYNIGPAISPNGRYMIFFSERDLFSIDMYLADTKTGKVLKKLSEINRNGHLDAVATVETSVSWSPDNTHIAFVGFANGRNVLILKDVFSEKRQRIFSLNGVPAFTSPSWSPDGRFILISGLVNGQVDLYAFEVATGKTTQVTNDRYSEVLASWSPDSEMIIYSTDRKSFDSGKTLGNLHYTIEILDLTNQEVTPIDILPSGDQLNVLFDPMNNGLWFLSNHDGYRDLFYYDLRTDSLFRETQLWTGISGITPFAPAISISSSGTFLYSVYHHNQYELFKGEAGTFLHLQTDLQSTRPAPGVLPADTIDLITQNISTIELISPDSLEFNKTIPYRPNFKLDYIGGQASVGISTNTLGAASGLNGGVNMFFSDILGYQQIFTGIALNGQLMDFAVQSAFINQKGRLPWGIGFSHIPYLSGAIGYAGIDTLTSGSDAILVDHFVFDQYRVFQDALEGTIYYPINIANRFELSGSMALYYNSYRRYDLYYFGPIPVDAKEKKLKGFKPQFIENLSTAYVHDHSSFGMASPSVGERYRLEFGRYFGTFQFNEILLDYRKYWFIKPITIAARVMHYGRLGNYNAINPLFIGNPGLVRGYSFNRFVTNFQEDYYFALDRLTGSKLGLFGMEVRVPLTGPERLALIRSRVWLSEIAFFLDNGIAWDEYEQLKHLNEPTATNNIQRTPMMVSSIGLSYRVNLGSAIFEPFYAIPLNKDFKPGIGINFLPGW